jgi:ABC-type Fe3+/spermidine/putrescine transport system ATPase subunit
LLVELMDIHKRLGMTFVYITHSQEEALTMSDRIILMRKGRIEQSGPPTAIFDRPVSRFVAGFMGVENLMDGKLVALDGDRATVSVDGIELEGRWSGKQQPAAGSTVAVGMRAERLHIADRRPAGDVNVLSGRMDSAIYKGKYLDRTVLTEIGPIKVRLWDSSSPAAEQGIVWWKKDDCMVMSI